ncbi:MAG: hypothetical protein ACI9R3_000086 [Verrucomicrobiales bacterium]|jgi:hypothetical protein
MDLPGSNENFLQLRPVATDISNEQRAAAGVVSRFQQDIRTSMFDRPYKKQKKSTPLSEEALKRFDKELPQRRSDWYTPRSHAEDDEQVADDPENKEHTEELKDAQPADFESNADADENADADDGVEPDNVTSEETPPENTRLHPQEVPGRLRFSEDSDSEEVAPRPSSKKMARMRAQALEEAKARHQTSADRRKGADFRTVHREAVKAKRKQKGAKWDDGTEATVRKKPRIGMLEVLGVLTIVIVGIVVVSKFTGSNKSEVAQTALPEEVPFSSIPEQSMEQMLEAFYQCKTVDEMLDYVRAPEIVEPLMRAWYASHPIQPTRINLVNSTEGMVSDGVINAPDQLWITANTIRLVDHQASANVMVQRTKDAYKLDWETATEASEEAFENFLKERPAAKREIRGRISPSDYYNYHFEDKERWVCYRFFSKSDAHSCFAYVARGSALEGKLGSWFYPGEDSIPVILTVKFPADARGNEVEVEVVEAVQKNWIRFYR